MKLFLSVLPLKNMLDATLFAQAEFQSAARDIYNHNKADNKIKCAYTALRYSIWNGLSKEQKDKIISYSNIEKIGGYYQYNDYHLDTLLRKVLPTTYLIKLVS